MWEIRVGSVFSPSIPISLSLFIMNRYDLRKVQQAIK